MIDLFMDMQTHDDGLQEDSDEGDETGHVYFAIMLSFGVHILLSERFMGTLGELPHTCWRFHCGQGIHTPALRNSHF